MKKKTADLGGTTTCWYCKEAGTMEEMPYGQKCRSCGATVTHLPDLTPALFEVTKNITIGGHAHIIRPTKALIAMIEKERECESGSIRQGINP